ncbi:MAG: arsenate reductase ArsC [Candidatus Methylomirabilota bacterium]
MDRPPAGDRMSRRLEVMFVCTGNSARSQMAEGFARHLGQGRIEAYSAGMVPTKLNPFAVAVMQEKGIDISHQRSRAFDENLARRMDVVVTVCGNADERCPILPPGVKKLHWPLDDPAAVKGTDAEILAKFREIRDQIEGRIMELMNTVE